MLHTGGTGRAESRHTADTWQTWAFLFSAALTVAFAVTDGLAPPAWHGWPIVTIKLVVSGVVFWVIMVNNSARSCILRRFDRLVKYERLN